jgi:hypothetical protein
MSDISPQIFAFVSLLQKIFLGHSVDQAHWTNSQPRDNIRTFSIHTAQSQHRQAVTQWHDRQHKN